MLNRTIDLDIKVLNHILLTLQVTTMSKKQNLYTQFFAKNKMVESTDHETGITDATSTEVWSQNSDEGSGSKAEMHKFHDIWKSEFLWLIYDSSNNVIYCDVCGKAGPDITGKTEFVIGKKKFKRESLVY